MKPEKISIKWKIFIYILLFAAGMILLLWLLQIVFLNDFYQSIKKGEIKDAAQTIEQNIDNENVQTLIDRIAHRYDVCVRITDMEGDNVYTSDMMPDCVIHKMPSFEFSLLAQEAQENGGTLLKILPRKQFSENNYNDQHFLGNVPPPDTGLTESLIYTEILRTSDGQELVLALNSVITPVTSTVETLRVQLIYITIILVVCALVIAIVISRRVSRPIIRINRSAKKLAMAEYDVRFDDRGYKEISELAETLNYASRELSKVEGLRRELIANISHDLRTPLTLITGYAEVMRDLPGENTPENVQIIIDEAKRLTTLVNDVMDISKLQSGTQELNVEPFNLTQLVRDILKRYTKLTEQDGFHIALESEGDVTVCADEVKISQVIYNLVNNAVNYAGTGKKVIVRQSTRNDTVRIEVQDDGEGIPQDKLAYIWDRYYKVDKTHKRASVGTGLGLSIVKGILDLHHAEYGVESEQGKGSVFWFELKIFISSS